MALYTVRCKECGSVCEHLISFERLQKLLEEDLCPVCGGKPERLFEFTNIYRPSSSYAKEMGKEYAPLKTGW